MGASSAGPTLSSNGCIMTCMTWEHSLGCISRLRTAAQGHCTKVLLVDPCTLCCGSALVGFIQITLLMADSVLMVLAIGLLFYAEKLLLTSGLMILNYYSVVVTNGCRVRCPIVPQRLSLLQCLYRVAQYLPSS